MAEISAGLVKQLRDRTGAGMMDCKRALQETNGDIEKAIDYLREKGLASAAKKAGRVASEGIVYSYIHGGGRVGVLLELNSETDFVAKTDDFKSLAHEIALQIAAMKAQFVRREDVPADLLEREREIYRQKALNEGKKPEVAERIVEGQVKKFYETNVLLDQAWVKDDKKTIGDLIKEHVAKIGENIQVRRFVRWEVGEGMEKRDDDFGGEVAKLIQ